MKSIAGYTFTPAVLLLVFAAVTCFTSCGIYTFRDVSIPDNVKTIKIGYFDNRAGIQNPQLSSKLTDAFKQKVQSYIRKASVVNSENADYIITGYINQYAVTTSGISNQQTSSNRLTVGVHLIFNNTLKNDTKEYDVSLPFDFSATLTLSQAENQLLDDIIKNLSDEMFNRIFSSW
ncbi:MAG TPA: LPS assembly lipoprotein LptE [Chitinophagaceae bacterium]|nr:LPS assembly lipoprotein LptE [Chitinophagaceae bacterium]